MVTSDSRAEITWFEFRNR